MYHHVNSDRRSNDLKMLDKHLEYISKNFISLFPTLKNIPKKAICLVFDDIRKFRFKAFIKTIIDNS